MKPLSDLKITQPFIALFGSGNSIHDLSEQDFAVIKANAFVITVNYAPVRLNGHMNMWSDRKVSEFLEAYYGKHPKKNLALVQESRVTPKLKEQVEYCFNRGKEKLKGNYTIVWALQLLQTYFPKKKILLFGVDMYASDNDQAKWYDSYTDFDKQRRGKRFKVQAKLNQCEEQIARYISAENVYNCNLDSQLDFFEKRDWKKLFYLKILHLCPSSLAGAPVHLSEIINKYTNCTSKTILKRPFRGNGLNRLRWSYDLSLPSKQEIEEAIDWADVVHYHRNVYPYEVKHKPSLIQYHSQPRGYKPTRTDAAFNDRKLVIAQYHPRFYTDARIVPNLIDIWDERFKSSEKAEDKVSIFYSWATETKSGWGRKGSRQTKGVLDEIKLKYGERVEVKIMNNKKYDTCLVAKRKAHICIDECVTGSYHLQSLEGCSVGAVTFNNIDEKTLGFLQEATGATDHPFIKTNLDQLFDQLCFFIENKSERLKVGAAARQWMEKWWDPKILVSQFIESYINVIHDKKVISNPTTVKPVRINSAPKPRRRPLKQASSQMDYRPAVKPIGKPIEELHKKHEGRDIYIFGTGPSLFKADPDLFKDEICFGINYAFEVMPFIDYHLFHVIETYESVKEVIPSEKMLLPETLVRQYFKNQRIAGPKRLPPSNPEAYVYRLQNPYQKRIAAKHVNLDQDAEIFTWSSTTHSAIHLAAYMGAKNIFLIGMDYQLYPDGKVHFESRFNPLYHQQKWNANRKHQQGDEWLNGQLRQRGVIIENIGAKIKQLVFS